MSLDSARSIFEKLDKISRERALTDVESLTLEQAIQDMDSVAPHKAFRSWTQPEEDRLFDLIAEGKSFSAAGKIIGRTKDSCIGRFHYVTKYMGAQAA